MIVDGRKRHNAPLEPGDFEFVHEDVEGADAVVGLVARCPCGCGEAYLGFAAVDEPRFTWNGADAPTIFQTIVFPACGRAFTLTAGVWLDEL